MSERTIQVAVLQCELGGDEQSNVERVAALCRDAAAAGAQVILPPELFEGPYFPREEREREFARARPVESHPTLRRFSELAAELGVAIPVSFFEKAGQAYYNSVAFLDADGRSLGVYRKSHIPDGPGYEEKFYFRPGDSGFRVFDSRFGKIGVGICWDQWFPECARAMALMGAELLLYPTAIGSEPQAPEMDTRDPWRRVMTGHAVANAMPVAAANRVGDEEGQLFYGSSFVVDARGDLLAELSRAESGFATTTLDLDAIAEYRAAWGFFRDRRPELYDVLGTADGVIDRESER